MIHAQLTTNGNVPPGTVEITGIEVENFDHHLRALYMHVVRRSGFGGVFTTITDTPDVLYYIPGEGCRWPSCLHDLHAVLHEQFYVPELHYTLPNGQRYARHLNTCAFVHC
jgi:hypothetical protein